ncbi:MAG: type II secretion system F family protein [Alphaproteobacteria bacterium]|nr:type II secretion system F family protein [Alphaproteobacteria bacterium]
MLVQFTALNEAGEIVTDTHHSGGKSDLHTHLREHHLTLVHSKTLRPHGFLGSVLSNFLPGLRTVPLHDISSFMLRLSVLLEAGRPLLDALEDVRQSLDNTHLVYVATMLKVKLQQGTDFVSGLNLFPTIFDTMVIKIIDRGMKSGKLAEHVKKAHESLQQKMTYQKRFKKITLYPAFLLITMVVMFVGFSQFLLPEVVRYMEDMGTKELPLASQLLMITRDFFEHYGFMLLFFLGLCILMVIGFISHPRIQYYLTPLVARIPGFGHFYTRLSLLPWLCTVGELYGVGVDFKNSLEEGKESIKNPYFRRKIKAMHQTLLDGVPLATTMKESMLFPTFVIALCDLGMKSGNLSSFFMKAYEFEKDAIHTSITKTLGILEPLLIILMGGLLLWLVMAVILPLYGNLNI